MTTFQRISDLSPPAPFNLPSLLNSTSLPPPHSPLPDFLRLAYVKSSDLCVFFVPSDTVFYPVSDGPKVAARETKLWLTDRGNSLIRNCENFRSCHSSKAIIESQIVIRYSTLSGRCIRYKQVATTCWHHDALNRHVQEHDTIRHLKTSIQEFK